MSFAAETVFVSDRSSILLPAKRLTGAVVRTPEDLTGIVSRLAASDEWRDRVQFRTDYRWYDRVHHGEDYDSWLISWMPGQSTGFHDHGQSAGAFFVASGVLQADRPGARALTVGPGQQRAFGADYAHDVRNVSLAPAVSIHAYSPPLTGMNKYEVSEGRLVPRDRVSQLPGTTEKE